MIDKRLLSFVAAYGAYFAFLHVVDGPWRHWKKTPGVYDNWTLTHLAWAALAKRWGITFNELMTLTVVNEGLEYALRQTRPDLLFGTEESWGNVARDVAYTALAYKLTPGAKNESQGLRQLLGFSER